VSADLAVEPPADLTIRPRAGHVARALLGRLGLPAALLLVLAVLLVATGQPRALPVAVFLALTLAGVAAFVATCPLVGSVRVRGDEVSRAGWTGVRRCVASRARGVRKLDIVEGAGNSYPLFVVVEEGGRCALALSGLVWRDAELDALTERLGLPAATWSDPMTYAAARAACPGEGLPLMVAHPYRFALTAAAPALAAVVAIVWLVGR